jgi:hypothetical protein
MQGSAPILAFDPKHLPTRRPRDGDERKARVRAVLLAEHKRSHTILIPF